MSPSFTSNSSHPFRFLAKAMLFLTPLVLPALFIELLFYRSGENWSVEQVLRAQAQNPETIYSRSFFSQQFNLFKTKAIERKQPEILALGSSRVMQLREEMFHPLQTSFYNGGGMIQRIEDLPALAGLFDEGLPRPKVLILGIDPWWLKKGRTPKPSWLEEREDKTRNFAGHLEAARLLVKDRKMAAKLMTGSTSATSTAYALPVIGLNSQVHGLGFRKDGSLLNEKHILNYLENPVFVDGEKPPIYQRILNHGEPFTRANEISEPALQLLFEVLEDWRAKGTEVYVFLPPFSTPSYEALLADDAYSRWWKAFSTDLPEQLRSRGIPCLVTLYPGALGLDDRYMIDGFHPTEVFVGRILEELLALAPPESLLTRVDRDKLYAMGRAAQVLPICFDPPPK